MRDDTSLGVHPEKVTEAVAALVTVVAAVKSMLVVDLLRKTMGLKMRPCLCSGIVSSSSLTSSTLFFRADLARGWWGTSRLASSKAFLIRWAED